MILISFERVKKLRSIINIVRVIQLVCKLLFKRKEDKLKPFVISKAYNSSEALELMQSPLIKGGNFINSELVFLFLFLTSSKLRRET